MIGNALRTPRIVTFGEILFDCFPRQQCLGGAPLNLSVHLQRQGAQVTLVSAVGKDELGQQALQEVARQGLTTACIAQLDYATGSVLIELDGQGVPSYRFREDCAYDHIPCPPPEALPNTCELFCFGTLAQRGMESRHSLQQLLEKTAPAKVFCDVNLRQNFFNREILQQSLLAADWVKLNDEEMPILADLLDFRPENAAMAEKFQLQTVIQTLGPKGCQVFHDGALFSLPAVETNVVSTVGAGDSFSAAFLYQLLQGNSARAAAQAGNELAARVASQQGAF